MTARRSLLRAATPLMVGRTISSVLTFAIPIVLARRLAPADYGTYKQFFLLTSTVYLVGQLGLPGSLYFFLPRERQARGQYLVQTLVGLFMVGGVAAVGIALAGDGLAARFSNPALAALAVPLALHVWAFLGAAPLEIALTAHGRTGWAGTTYVLSDLVRTVAMTVPIALGWGIRGLAWAAVAFAVVRLVAAWALVFGGALAAPLQPTRASVRSQLRYTLPFAGAVLLATAQMQLPQYVVSALTDAATYAIFAVGVLQLPVTDLLYTPIAEIMMVRLAAASREEAPAIFREAVSRLVLFFLPLAGFLLAVGGELIPTLYTRTYVAAAAIFLVAVAEIPLSALPVDGLLRATDGTRIIFGVSVARLVICAALVPAGLVLLGLPGAMAGYVVTQWIAKSTLLFLAARRLGAPLRAMLPLGEIVAWAARAALIAGGVTLLRLETGWLGVRFLVAACVVGAILWGLALLQAGELRRRAPLPATLSEEAHLG